MPNLLGVYWAPGHMRNEDLEYMRALNPNAVRVFEADGHKMELATRNAPGAMLFPRIHSISEDGQKNEMDRDPEGTGRRHAEFWRLKISEWRQQGHHFVDDSQMAVVGINEPRMWPDPFVDRKSNYQKWYDETMKRYDVVSRYNISFLKRCDELGLRGCALNLSVGWPPNLRDDEAPYWTPFAGVAEAIGKRHFLVVHEYWYRTGISEMWKWHAGRFTAIPWDVPIVIGECGIENAVDLERQRNDGLQRGWQNAISAAGYAAQLSQYVAHLEKDGRVFAAFPFLTDYYNNEWASLDTKPCSSEILSALKNKPSASLPFWPRGTVTPPVTPPVEPPSVSKKQPLIWPISPQNFSQFFGEGDYSKFGLSGHNGTDLATPVGTPVKASGDGVVVFTDNDANGYGLYIRLFHPELTLCTFYGHLSRVDVKAGDKVKQGQVIGLSGNTGNSTGPHLHFETRIMTDKTGQQYSSTYNDKYGKRGQIDSYAAVKLSQLWLS